MMQPLALVLYEKLLPGTQLVNRLQDLGYRVRAINDPASLVQTAEEAGPLIVFADLEFTAGNVLDSIAQLRKKPTTSHVPVVAFGPKDTEDVQDSAKAAGVTLLASETALAHHLPQVLEQALRID